jgi:hypothetical protein
MKRRRKNSLFCIWGRMLSSSIPTRRAIWNQRIMGFWVFETRENQRTIFGFGHFRNFKELQGSGYLKQERIKEPSSISDIYKTSKTKTGTLKFLNPTKTDVQFRNQII